jgi:hypothetical protein
MDDLQTPPNAAGLCDVNEKVPRYDFDRLVAIDTCITVYFIHTDVGIVSIATIHSCDSTESVQ